MQEAYEAAVYHTWRSNALMTCYEPMMVDYAPTSVEILVQQAATLGAIGDEGIIDAEHWQVPRQHWNTTWLFTT